MTWNLLTRKAIWEMEGDKVVRKIKDHDGVFTILPQNWGNNIVVNFNREEPTPLQEKESKLKPIFHLLPRKDCFKIIKEFEGYHRALPNGDCTAYPDVGSDDGEPITIGWGTTSYQGRGLAKYGRSKVMMGDILTREQAESELELDVYSTERGIEKLLPGLKLTQSMHDAIVSFFFNLSRSDWGPQIERLKKGDMKGFHDALDLYVNGGNGKPLAGLIRRRNAEQALFVKDGWGDFPAETEEPEEPVSDVMTLRKSGGNYDGRWGGLVRLKLTIGDESFNVISGLKGAQNFRLPGHPQSVPGNREPIPQGRYRLTSAEPIFAGKRDDYSKSHGTGFGATWDALQAEFKDDRGAFGLHLDNGVAGSLGCVCFANVEDEKRYVAARRRFPKVRTLVVDWGL